LLQSTLRPCQRFHQQATCPDLSPSPLPLLLVLLLLLQASQALNQVISSTVPLTIPSALNLPMGASLDINAQTRTGEKEAT
jgi:hypothetical protein